MSIVGDRVAARLAALGMSQSELARAVGMKPQGVQSIIAGSSQRPRLLREIAAALSTTQEYLIGERDDPALPPIFDPLAPSNVIGPPQPVELVRSIPVYGRAIGGDDGYFLLNGEKIGELLAPPSLAKVKGAYAVLVAGVSMEPRYYAGEAVYLNPNLPPRRGDFVVVQTMEGDDPIPRAFVKQFVRWNSDELVLHQFNPDTEVRVDAGRVLAVHRIVFSGEGL